MGSTAPSRAGFRNLFECHAVASGPVSASPSPMMQATSRPGLSKAAPKAWDSEYPSSPPSLIDPGTSGAQWLGIPPGNENCLNSRFNPCVFWPMSGYMSV
jgi:hypothetical protein